MGSIRNWVVAALRREGICLGLLCFHLATSKLLCLEDLPKSLCSEFGEEGKTQLVRVLFFAKQDTRVLT